VSGDPRKVEAKIPGLGKVRGAYPLNSVVRHMSLQRDAALSVAIFELTPNKIVAS